MQTMNAVTIWSDILERLMMSVNTIAFQIYFEKVVPHTVEDKTLVLAVPLRSHKQELENHYRRTILDAMRDVNSPCDEYRVILITETQQYQRENVTEPEKKQDVAGLPFIRDYTFDNFVVGDSNRIAFEASKAVAQHPGSRFNPMFIYSRPGLGKTHLLNAIGNYLYEQNPNLNVLYITAENFTNDYISAIRNNRDSNAMQNFNARYRSQDVLMIDDIQFFEKAEKTQEVLFHIFNDLYGQGKQIILSSDRPIRNLTFLEERLASRFAAGISIDISSPSKEERIAILQKKAHNMCMNVPKEVLEYLADAERENIRILEGLLKTVELYSMLNKQAVITVEFAKKALRDSVTSSEESITIQSIVAVCCTYFGVSLEDITGKRRNKEYVVPRQYAIYVITVVMPSTPLQAIAEFFNRDHSTVCAARDKIGMLYQTDAEAKRIVEDLKNLTYNK